MPSSGSIICLLQVGGRSGGGKKLKLLWCENFQKSQRGSGVIQESHTVMVQQPNTRTPHIKERDTP